VGINFLVSHRRTSWLLNVETNDHAHFYSIRHRCDRLPLRDAGVRASTRSPSAIRNKPPAESSTDTHSIEVVDIKDLQRAVRSKIDNIIAHTSKEDMQSLRQSIDATPAAASALKAKGLSSSQVVAINIADGVLTLVAKTA
jgi:hypothetical protein